MDPQYFPRSSWSLWARTILDLGSKITKISAPHKLVRLTGSTRCQPVEPVEENYEILIKFSLKNKEAKKKNKYTIPSPYEGDMIKTRRSAHQNYLKKQCYIRTSLRTSQTDWSNG